MTRWFRRAVLVVVAGWTLFAQGAEFSESRGFTFYERFLGSVNTLGAVDQLDTTVGYNFNSHFAVDGGIPIYFVRPASSTTAATGVYASNGIGNVYGQIRLTLANPILNFASTVTGSAPTGDKATGFSTGHATVDWSNYFDHSFSKLTPFANLGIANSVSDTMFFVRPYITYGVVSHLEGGARYRLARIVSVGAAAYGIEPSGQQTVISRIVKSKQTPPHAPSNSSRKDHGVFETSNLTTGTADIARDHGFSTWVQVQPVNSLGLYAGYTRSLQYALDTVFFGVTFNLGRAIRSLGI